MPRQQDVALHCLQDARLRIRQHLFIDGLYVKWLEPLDIEPLEIAPIPRFEGNDLDDAATLGAGTVGDEGWQNPGEPARSRCQ